MRRWLAMAGAAALAAAAGCADPVDPCAFGTGGAPWLALGTLAPGNWDVEVIRADGTCRRSITTAASVDLRPAWSRGGLLAYDSDRAPAPGQDPFPGLWLHDVAAGTERRLELGDLGASSPAFSPDGATLAFQGLPRGATESGLYVVPAAGGTPALLTPTPAGRSSGGPAWSPDGTLVYFTSNRDGPWDVYRVPAAGGAAERVTTGSGIVGRPAVSPDGASLAYARSVGSTTEVVLRDLATGVVTAVTGREVSEPAFDPAGGRLAVRVFRGLTATIDLVPLAGGEGFRLTTGPGPDGVPAFAPLEP
jgi:TolB protein